MTDLSGVSTDALVDELVKREGIDEMSKWVTYTEIFSIKKDYSNTRIIVVQGVE